MWLIFVCVGMVFYICWFIVGVMIIWVVVVRNNVVSKLLVILFVSLVRVLVVVGVISNILVYLVSLMWFMVVLVVGFNKLVFIGWFDIVCNDSLLIKWVVELVNMILIMVFCVVSFFIRFGVL